jgi:predicted amidophosphoribosyltransferase
MALGDLLAMTQRGELARWHPDAVVAIPMHWSRRMWRGVHSAEIVAGRLAAHLDVPLASHLLVRRRRTAPQARLAPSRRKANVRGAFGARASRDLARARLLLVDDIMTTGATLNEAAKTLLDAGADAVGAAVVARAEVLD